MFSKRIVYSVFVCLLVFCSTSLQAQDAAPVIGADNVQDLQPVLRVDFDADVIGRVDTGWFALSGDGRYATITTHAGVPVTWQLYPPLSAARFQGGDMPSASLTGGIVAGDTLQTGDDALPPALIDIVYDAANRPYHVTQTDGRVLMITPLLTDDDEAIAPFVIDFAATGLDGVPVQAWTSGNHRGEFWPEFWIEVMADDPYLLQLGADGAIQTHAYAPSQQAEASVRIGRIAPPYAVTSDVGGVVTLWDLQRGEVLARVDNGTGQPAVFGALNAAGTHLVWRDPMNEAMYLLDFAAGENRLVAELNGAYAQWFFLSNDASTIIAVNLDFEPHVIVWDVATGEQSNLGAYRDCSRVPDMARLSADGTTLVIGCDSGLDVWRVVPEHNQ